MSAIWRATSANCGDSPETSHKLTKHPRFDILFELADTPPPLDFDAVVAIVEQCGGKALIVHEAVHTGGFGAELGMRLVEYFSERGQTLKVARLTTPDVRMPAAPNLQATLIPNANSIVDRAKSMLAR